MVCVWIKAEGNFLVDSVAWFVKGCFKPSAAAFSKNPIWGPILAYTEEDAEVSL